MKKKQRITSNHESHCCLFKSTRAGLSYKIVCMQGTFLDHKLLSKITKKSFCFIGDPNKYITWIQNIFCTFYDKDKKRCFSFVDIPTSERPGSLAHAASYASYGLHYIFFISVLIDSVNMYHCLQTYFLNNPKICFIKK